MKFSVDEERFNSLTEREQKYFKIMNAQSGVLFIKSEPGIAKSSILRAIADKLGMAYFDIRLSMVDEIDVGLFPYRKEVEIDDEYDKTKKRMISLMAYAIPEWAYRSNERPTIIHFEELNRAPLAVRNAALQILLERSIGTDFHFNEDVYMVASGNMGDEDGTDVEEFDRALNNRLIHVSHSLSLPEWIDNYADKHIHPAIVDFLKSHEEHYLASSDKKRNNEALAYPTPRSWTFLSDYIVKNYGMKSSVREWSEDVTNICASYVGTGCASAFKRYIESSLKFGINDLLNRYDEIESMLKTCTRDKHSELLNALKQKSILEFNKKQKENVKKYIITLSDDEAVSYLLDVLDNGYKYMKENDNDNDVVEEFLKDPRFKKYYAAIMKHIPSMDEEQSDK